MIAPGDERARGIDAPLEEMESRGAVQVVPHVVFARPQELHWRAVDHPGDPRALDDAVVVEASPETAAHPLKVHDDIGVADPERFCGELHAVVWQLARRPDFELAVGELRRAVLGLERRVREERVVVGALGGLRRRRDRRIDVAVAAHPPRGCLRGKLLRARGETGAALRGGRALVPRDLKLFTRRARLPPAVGHNRDTGHQPRQIGRALDDKRVSDSGHRLDGVEIRADDLPAEDRTLLEHGVQHPGPREVDAEERLAGDDQRIVHARRRLADDLVFLLRFERQRREVWRRQGRGFRRHRAITDGSVGGRMEHLPRRRRALARRHVPVRSGRRDEHVTRGSTDLSHGSPIVRRRRAAAGGLPAVLRRSRSACSIRTALQSTSSSSAISIGSIVLTPCPTSGFLAVIVTMPFASMRMNAFGDKGGGGVPGPCANPGRST